MEQNYKDLVWLRSEVKTPPFSSEARLMAGYLLRWLQSGERLQMPESRPMPSISKGCHELRIPDGDSYWRIIYRIDDDAIIIAHLFKKKTNKTPQKDIKTAQMRLKQYDSI